MKLNISCATKIYPIEIDVEQLPNNVDECQTASTEEDSTVNAEKISTFGSLKQQVCSLCNIDPTALKIVHRGRILMGNNSTSLSSFNFKENDKLLILGKPPTTQTDVGWKLLVDFERKHTANISRIYTKNENDLTQLEKIF
ncbi:BMA-BAG-1 [Dirofilaria immitis]|nr:BMA-BAG-1 [Dirofilaria immitis]